MVLPRNFASCYGGKSVLFQHILCSDLENAAAKKSYICFQCAGEAGMKSHTVKDKWTQYLVRCSVNGARHIMLDEFCYSVPSAAQSTAKLPPLGLEVGLDVHDTRNFDWKRTGRKMKLNES